jgi:hypothetical protein
MAGEVKFRRGVRFICFYMELDATRADLSVATSPRRREQN